MSDPVAAVAEADATGETAAIFADIRAVYGVSVVNLIWRHLATFPGALPWAWGTVRPLYADGVIAREAAVLRASRRLPAIPAVPRDVFLSSGLTAEDLRQIEIVLDAYERTNPMALVALSVLEQALAGVDRTSAGTALAVAPSRQAEAELRLPPLLRLDQMAPTVADLVVRLNRIGATRADPILASMYRNLAHWPPYLALAWTILAPLGERGDIAAAIKDIRELARLRARAISASEARVSHVSEAGRAAILEAIERFTGDAICRMVVVCGILRDAGLAR